jgi:DNA-binding phage protein
MSTMTNYDVESHLRTEGDRAAYLDAWVKHSPDDAAGTVRAKSDIARAAAVIKVGGFKDENQDSQKW